MRGDAVKEPVARFLSTAVALNRTLAAPPGTPAERLDVLRAAFARMAAREVVGKLVLTNP